MTAKQYQSLELENSVEERVTRWLQERGWQVHPLVTEVERGYRGKSRRNPPGTPDLIAVRRDKCEGRDQVFYLELKRAKGGKLSKFQIEEHKRLSEEGLAVFAHQSNGSDVVDQLNEFATYWRLW